MLQINNQTPFIANIAVFPDENAIDSLYVMVKSTFNMGHTLSLTSEQKPITQADEYYDEPGLSSLKYPSDYHTGKPTTDIIMLGSACAPDRHAVRQLDVSLQVGKQTKTVRVFGNRQWQNGRITRPDTFETMRMRYEKAYGGRTDAGDCELRNPVGSGLQCAIDSLDMNGVELPNLENPADLIQRTSDKPEPFCFAAIAPNWLPRANLAGTYDEQWEAERAPFLPHDYKPAFMNSAAYGLRSPKFLLGGEEVYISGMHPSGDLHFELPQIELGASVLLGDTKQKLTFDFETLILEPNELSFSINWRAKLICGKKLSKVKDITLCLKNIDNRLQLA